jgi:hypothetical protein
MTENNNSLLWGVYPNPASGDITIGSTGQSSGCMISVLNSVGTIVRTARAGPARIVIDVSGLPAGLYFIMPEDHSRKGLAFLKE